MTTRQKQLMAIALTAAWFIPDGASAQTSLSVGNVPGYPGATVTVPVNLRRGGNVVATQFDVAFNPGKVSALEVLRGERLTNHVIRSRQIAPGVERVLIYSLNNAKLPATNATAASLPFTVSPTEYVSSGPLTPQNVILAQADGAAATPVSVNSGTIFVRPVNPLPNGSVQFFLPSAPDEIYAIQASTNLVEWTDISTNTASSLFLDLLDPDALLYPIRFYRWRREP